MKSSRAKASVNIYPDERRSNRVFIDYDPTITYRQAVSSIYGIVGPKSEMTNLSLHGNPNHVDYSGLSGWFHYKFCGKQLTVVEERFGVDMLALLDQDCVPESPRVNIETPVAVIQVKDEQEVDNTCVEGSVASTSSDFSSSKRNDKGKKKMKAGKGKKRVQIPDDSTSPTKTGNVPPANEYIEYTRVRRDKMAVTCAQMARNKFPITHRTEANRLVVRKYIYGLLEQHGLRPQHIRATLDISVSLAFVPDQVDLMVNAFESTQAYVQRLDEHRRPHTTGWFKNLFTWMPKVIPHQGYDRS
jgi:hypothetical protein